MKNRFLYTRLLSLYCIFIFNINSTYGQQDVAIKFSKQSIINSLQTLADARALNYGAVNESNTELLKLLVLAPNQINDVRLDTNRNIEIDISGKILAKAGWLIFNFDVKGNFSATMVGSLEIDTSNSKKRIYLKALQYKSGSLNLSNTGFLQAIYAFLANFFASGRVVDATLFMLYHETIAPQYFAWNTLQFTVNSNEIILSVAIDGSPVNVTVRNDYNTVKNYGSIERLENQQYVAYPSPKVFNLPLASAQSIRAKQDTSQFSNNIWKYKNWRRERGTNQYSEFQQNPYPFVVSFPDTYDAMFKEVARVNVANNLEGSVSGGTVTVNGTSSASFNDYLFKEQNQISSNVLNGTLGTEWSFQGWSNGMTTPQINFAPTSAATLIANWKGKRISNIPELAGKSGGSRTVAIDATHSNYWYQVYESNNAIWLSYSTNAGANWHPEVKLGDGKNPSIANDGVVWVNGGINFRTVGFQDGNLNLGSIWSSSAHNALQPFLFVDPIPDAHPCIAHKFESDGSSSWYIVYEHRLRQGLTAPATYPNTELRLIRLGYVAGTLGLKSLHTVPNSFYTQSCLSLYPAIATDNSSNPNVNTPATIVWQNYVPSVSDGIKVCEANLVSGSLVFGAQHTFAPSASTVHYQKPTIVLDASNHRHVAWQALDHSHPYGARTVILYKVLPTWNDPSQPLTKFLYYDSKATPSVGFANGTVSLVWDYSGGTCFGATRGTNGTWGAWQSFFGEAPNLMQTGAKQIAHAKANSGLFDVKLTSLSGGGGSAQERGLSGGGKGNGVQAVTNSGSGGNDNGGESISVKARISALLFKENEALVKTAWLDLTLADVGLNGSSRTGLTYHDLGANLLPDTLALSPSNVFSLLKSRKFSRADTINQVSATVKVHSKSLYDLTQQNPVQLAVELFNAETNQSIALSQTALVTASDTAKEIHFTMNLPTGQSGTEVELRVKVLGFAVQLSHKASALNEIELVSGTGGAAIVNRVGGQAAQTQSVGSVPTKFALHQNYPNPFNPVAVIRYELPSNAMVKLQVFDVLGRVVATVVNDHKEAGIYEAVFNASSLSSGTYFYRLEARSSGSQAGSFVETKKMVLVK